MKGLDWFELSPDDVENLVAALLIDMYPGAVHVDGAGGDGGRDVMWRSPDGLVIFEVKSFRRRLEPTQRRQIRRSLGKALEHDPVRWVLALPLNHSPKELKWFEEVLSTDTKIPLEWWGRTKLELELAARRHILKGYVTSIQLDALAAVAEYGQEGALLPNGFADLHTRVSRLQARLSEHDPDYDFTFGSGPGRIDLKVSPRTPGATQRRPITASFSIEAPKTDEGRALADEYRRCLDYGTGVHIPAKFITRASLDAPFNLGFEVSRDDHGDLVSSSGMGVPSVWLNPTDDDASWQALGRIRICGADDGHIQDLAVDWVGRSSGARGCRMAGRDRLGRFTFEVLADWVDATSGAPLGLSLMFHPSPSVTPVEMLEALDWAAAVRIPNQMHFEVEGQVVFSAQTQQDAASVTDELRTVMEDLACIQRATRPFGLPVELTDEQGAAVQLAARLLREDNFGSDVSEVTLPITLSDPEAFLTEVGAGEGRMFALDGRINLNFLAPGAEVGSLFGFQGRYVETYEALEHAVQQSSTVRLRLAVTVGTARYQRRMVSPAA